MKEFIQEYGFVLFYALITAIATFIGNKLKSIYESKVQDEQKKQVVETCVKAAEQLYSALSGAEKLQACKNSVIQMLDAKGISISEIEMDMLIESVVAELNFTDIKIEAKTIDIPEEEADG